MLKWSEESEGWDRNDGTTEGDSQNWNASDPSRGPRKRAPIQKIGRTSASVGFSMYLRTQR